MCGWMRMLMRCSTTPSLLLVGNVLRRGIAGESHGTIGGIRVLNGHGLLGHAEETTMQRCLHVCIVCVTWAMMTGRGSSWGTRLRERCNRNQTLESLDLSTSMWGSHPVNPFRLCQLSLCPMSPFLYYCQPEHSIITCVMLMYIIILVAKMCVIASMCFHMCV